MGIDIRLPLGLLFILSDPALYQQSLGINVNLYWGAALLAFGAVMFALSRRGAREQSRTETPPPSPRS
jgi:hypothetical protein